MPGFSDKFMFFINQLPGFPLTSATARTSGRAKLRWRTDVEEHATVELVGCQASEPYILLCTIRILTNMQKLLPLGLFASS
jgi:hypothetical protein